MKNIKHCLNLILGGLIVLTVSASVFLIAIIGLPHIDDNPKSNENSSFQQIVNEQMLDKNQQKNLELIFGEQNYTLNGDIVEQINSITEELYLAPQDASVVFNPDGEGEVFVFKEESLGRQVDVDNLALYIKDNFDNNSNNKIVIPTIAIQPSITKKELEGLVQLRSEFSTSIVNSQAGRKHNVSYALKSFNGLVVLPDEQVSFNKVTGERTFNSNYHDAIIISNGQYVQGKGGGVCQASTTLYNALIRADVQIDKVSNHSIPVKYVPLAFDAMVNDTSSDLIFTNNTGSTLYFMTGADDEKVWVKIFGTPLENGLTIETKTETIRDIPKGDKIIPDTKGEYTDKILYKGEYYRIKYPLDGKECIGYLMYYKDGELVDQKEVRHVYYPGQEGIIMEGVEELHEGMTLPTNTVEFINPS